MNHWSPTTTQLSFCLAFLKALVPTPRIFERSQKSVELLPIPFTGAVPLAKALHFLDPASLPDLGQHPPAVGFSFTLLPSYLAFLLWLQPLPELSVDIGPLNVDHSLPKCQAPAAGKSPQPATHSVWGASPPMQSLWLVSKSTQGCNIVSVILQITFYCVDRQSRVTMY